MAGLILLLALCVVMALASFLAGALPLSMTLSQSQLRLISSIGVGVLVGTSLIVIIPEGIEAATAAASPPHPHGATRLMTRAGVTHLLYNRDSRLQTVPTAETHYILGPRQDGALDSIIPRHVDGRKAAAEHEHGGEELAPKAPAPPAQQVVKQAREKQGEKHHKGEGHKEEQNTEEGHKEEGNKEEGHKEEGHKEEGHKEEGHKEEEKHQEQVEMPTFEIGFSMVFGFVVMFLIDRLPRHAAESLHSRLQTTHMSLDDLSMADHGPMQDEADDFLSSLAPTPRRARSFATTVGLVIHAAADGIAIGASSSTSDTTLGLVVFVAIMIHKAPAAFGLTSVLLKQGLSKRAARGHLVVFSLAAPVGALSTWLLVNVLGGAHLQGQRGQWWTGMLLLFSGGTFLYVAMHAMQEDGASHNHHDGPGANGFADGSTGGQRKASGPQMRDTLATVAGIFLPLLTQFGHHHH